MQRHLAACLLLPTLAAAATAQYAERPHTKASGLAAVDVSGRSVKNPRVRAIHTRDATLPGGTADLLRRDPFLAYQLGRNLNFREFRERDGVFGPLVSQLAGGNPDGVTSKITANNQTSCLGCHNLPNGNPGGGANFSKDSGLGRNSPHYYGSGLMEMLAIQTRKGLLVQLDQDGNGWVSAVEAAAAGSSVEWTPSAGAAPLDYGDPRLDRGSTGSPQLNNILKVWYVDEDGQVVPGATEVDGTTTVGYNFSVMIWGWGQGGGRAALNPTNRAFLWDPFNAHSGLQAYDPSTTLDPNGDGVSRPTISGAIQFPVTHAAPDAGVNLDPMGFSRDDPDQDGHLNEISEGDLDLAEWFMLHAPRPAYAGTEDSYQAGLALMESFNCTSCHTPDWDVLPRGNGFEGDRRVFDLETSYDAASGELSGRLVPLWNKVGDQHIPKRGGFLVRGLFSDLRHHDLGERAREIDFGGTQNSLWRTPPLWGVGSGFPWFHDGASLTLEDAILRHGGAAEGSRTQYLAASPEQRAALVDFLGKLVLYDIESLPADIDGDGLISPAFQVAGQNTGTERFNAEWLFANPVQIEGPLGSASGNPVTSFAATNLSAAYGLTLELRQDSDGDGWPDAWDRAPSQPGFKNGVE